MRVYIKDSSGQTTAELTSGATFTPVMGSASIELSTLTPSTIQGDS